jgi:glycopeptide antibiotics resistance protein
LKKSFIITLILSLAVLVLLSPVFIQLISYLHPIVMVVVSFCIILLVLFFVLLFRKETLQLPYSLFKNLLVLYTIALLILLFFRPNDQNYDSMNLIPFSTISFYLSGKVNWLISFYNLAANIGLFIPYGIFLMVKNDVSILKLILLPLTTIALIEILQFLTHRGSMDIDDLILNLLGIFVGYICYPIFKKIVELTN